MREFPAGSGQLFVVYGSEEAAEEALAETLVAEVAADAEARAADGWRVVSSSVFTSRRPADGGAGSRLRLDQLATRLTASVVYARG
jgi:hypothetical protein